MILLIVGATKTCLLFSQINNPSSSDPLIGHEFGLPPACGHVTKCIHFDIHSFDRYLLSATVAKDSPNMSMSSHVKPRTKNHAIDMIYSSPNRLQRLIQCI